jgi:trigger factor
MKKIVFLVMGLSLMLLATGCGKKGAAGDLDNTSTNNSATTEKSDLPEYTASKYVTLGNYKGVEINMTVAAVTDKQVDEAIQNELANTPAYEEVKNKTVVENGDIVNIDYEGLKDNVAFEGGTAKGQHLTIGTNQFIEGFESGLIGHKVGEKVKLNLTFPKEYKNNPDLAGKAVVFNVTINKIEKQVTPKLTEEYVKTNTEFDSVAAYKKSVRDQLESQNKSSSESEKQNKLLNKIIDASKITGVPDSLLKYYEDSMRSQVEQGASQYNMDLESYLAQFGMKLEDFNKNLKTNAELSAKQELILKAIAEKEKLEVTDQELKDKAAELMKAYNYTKESDLYAQIPKEALKSNMLLQKAYDIILKSSVVKEVTPTIAPTPTTAAK